MTANWNRLACSRSRLGRTTLDRLSVIVDDLDAAKVKARSLFETLEMPQKPDGLRILDEDGCELFFWNQGKDDA
jgi:hypothetical protein